MCDSKCLNYSIWIRVTKTTQLLENQSLSSMDLFYFNCQIGSCKANFIIVLLAQSLQSRNCVCEVRQKVTCTMTLFLTF